MTQAATWPAGYRCGVAFSVDLDAESLDMVRAPAGNLWGRYSHGRYGLRVGVYRVLEIFKEHTVRATFFVPAWDAEREGRLMEEILREGHEIAAHGYAHEDHGCLGEDERATLEKAHHVLSLVCGRPPVGWRAPGGRLSARTLTHLVDLGYQYDASFYDDDLPHEIECSDGRSLLEMIPQFPFLNDTRSIKSSGRPSRCRRCGLRSLRRSTTRACCSA